MFERNKESRSEQPETTLTQETKPLPAVETASVANNSVVKTTTSVIGATTNIKGDVTSDENLVIEGRVEGTVNLASHELTVGRSGIVYADIIAKTIRIDGEVKGDITCKEKAVISKTGNVKGNIIAPRMTLEDGAKFKGSIDMDPSGADSEERTGSLSSLATRKASAPREEKAGEKLNSGNQGA